MERFAAAKDAGFAAVEMLSPYELNVQDVVSELAIQGLQMALINAPPPNYTGGAPGWAAVRGSRFQTDFKRAHRYSKTIGATHLHVMAGDAEGADARACFVENLRWAASEAPKQSITIEPLNPFDKPGYFLNDYLQGHAIVQEVAMPNVRLQFDAYHVERIHGDVPGVWSQVRDAVAHVQIAQAPDRTEPTDGPIDFAGFFDLLRADGYKGWIAAEYGPKLTTKAGLGWIKAIS